mmetsp:Transcript_45007/g.81189  ORF Transcript_45007/g.81189 Transcript_45007/m.81189 type:complete len:387 (-) Transcript_45007:39-1199(-)
MAATEAARLRAEIAEAHRRRERACVAKAHLQKEVTALRNRFAQVAKAEVATISAAASFDVGDVVCVVGSGDCAQLHGQEAVVIGKDVKKAKCKVRLANGEQRQLPLGNLKKMITSMGPTVQRKHFGLLTPLLSPSGLRLRSCLTAEAGGLPCELWPLVKTGMARMKLPDVLVATLAADLDAALRKAPQDHSENLCGEIRSGCQLLLQRVSPEFERMLLDLCNLLTWAIMGTNQVTCELDTVWGVVQRQGDYNTLQPQRCKKSPFGYSSLVDIQLPEQLNEANHERPSKGSYGYHDGMHSLVWKTDMSTDMENLIQPGILQNILVTGYLYIFPQWMPVSTHPFEGEGERRMIGANVAISDLGPEAEKMGVGPPTMSMGAPAGISTGH